MNLIERKPKRFFAFGCSFTEYHWSTWAEIVAYDLDIPFYNFGRSGAGNQYIANTVAQANGMYNFTEDDLIIVSWTNVCREDRWVKHDWITPGNIYTQGTYSQDWVEKFVDPMGTMIRDLATISLTRSALEGIGCQFHFISMVDIVKTFNQSGINPIINKSQEGTYEKLKHIYKDDMEFIKPSFFDVLWNNDIYTNKILPDREVYDNKFSDGHPNPKEHLQYLKSVFSNHTFQQDTEVKVSHVTNNMIEFIREHTKHAKEEIPVYKLISGDRVKVFRELTRIKMPMENEIIC